MEIRGPPGLEPGTSDATPGCCHLFERFQVVVCSSRTTMQQQQWKLARVLLLTSDAVPHLKAPEWIRPSFAGNGSFIETFPFAAL